MNELKPYSEFSYSEIKPVFRNRYIQEKLGLVGDEVFSLQYFSDDLNDKPIGCYVVIGRSERFMISDVDQAFADACLNGEVPGMWWE